MVSSYENWLGYYITRMSNTTEMELTAITDKIQNQTNGFLTGSALYYKVAQNLNVQLLGIYDIVDKEPLPLTDQRKQEIMQILEGVLHAKEGTINAYLRLTASDIREHTIILRLFNKFNRIDVLHGLSCLYDWLSVYQVK